MDRMPPHNRSEFLINHIVSFIDRQSLALFLVLSVWYLGSAILMASQKLMWNDELLTLYFSGIPRLEDLWFALSTTHEQSPPFFYLITRLFIPVTNSNELNIRFPEIIGVWIALFSIFLIVKKRSSGLYGLMAALFPLTTSVFYYSHEARPYGLMLGFTASSFMLWQIAAAKEKRKLVIPLLAISNVALAGSHYYGFLGVVPLFIGELVNTFQRRRFDTAVWLCLLITIVPLVFVIPIIIHGGTLAADFWAHAKWSSIIQSYKFALEPALIPLIGIMILVALDSLRGGRQLNEGNGADLPRRELLAIVGLLLVPVFAVIVSKVSTGAFTERYALISVIGFSILLSLAAGRTISSRKMVLLGILAVLFLFSSVKVIRESRKYMGERTRLDTTLRLLDARIDKGGNVAIADPHLFFQLAHYAPQNLKRSMIYIADRAASKRWVGTSWLDLTLEEIKAWIPLNVQSYSSFVDTKQSLFVYSTSGRWEWLVRQLQATGGQLLIIERNEPDLLLLWRPPGIVEDVR